MSNMNQSDEKQTGSVDKDQKDREQRSRDQQSQQSTGQPRSPGAGQQSGHQDDKSSQQGGKAGVDHDQSGKTQR